MSVWSQTFILNNGQSSSRKRKPLCKERQSTESEAPRPQAGASREGNVVLIVLLDPAYPALAGRGTCRPRIRI